MRGVVACLEDVFGDPPSDGLLVSAEHGGGTSPIDAGPGDHDGLADVADDGTGEDDVVFESLLDSARRVDGAAIVIDTGVRSAEAEAPRAHRTGEGRCESSACSIGGFEPVTPDSAADAVPGFEQITIDLVHRKNVLLLRDERSDLRAPELTSRLEHTRMMCDVRRQRAI